MRLFCEQHEGLFISNRRSAEVLALLQGVPNSLLLEHVTGGGLHLLVSAGTRPRRVALADGSPVDRRRRRQPPAAATARRPSGGRGAHQGRCSRRRREAATAPRNADGGSIVALLQPFPSELDLGGAGNEVWRQPRLDAPLPVRRAPLRGLPLLADARRGALPPCCCACSRGQYDAVDGDGVAHACATGRSRLEERQIVQLLAQANNDRHPDAHACRAARLAARDAHAARRRLPWDVSASCARTCTSGGTSRSRLVPPRGRPQELLPLTPSPPPRRADGRRRLLLPHTLRNRQAAPRGGDRRDRPPDGGAAGGGARRAAPPCP